MQVSAELEAAQRAVKGVRRRVEKLEKEMRELSRKIERENTVYLGKRAQVLRCLDPSRLGGQVWPGTPIWDTSCCSHPLTWCPIYASRPRKVPAGQGAPCVHGGGGGRRRT